MDIKNSEEELLIPKENEGRKKGKIKGTRCRFSVEVVLIMSTLSGFPKGILDPLLVTQLIGKEFEVSLNSTLVENATHSGNGSVASAQEKAATFIMYQNLMVFFPSLIACLFLGAYSDRAGRKYALVPPDVATALSTVISLCVVKFELSVYFMLLASFVDGIGGRLQMWLTGVFGFIADTTESNKKTFRIVVVESLMSASTLLGILGLGVWIESMGFFYPYIFVICTKMVVVFIVIFILPETVEKDPKAKFFSTSHLKNMGRTFYEPKNVNRSQKLALLFVSFQCGAIVLLSGGLDSLFLTNAPLYLSTSVVGYYFAAYIGAIALGGVISNKLLSFCLADHWIAIIGGVSFLAANFYKAFVVSFPMIWFVPALAVLGGSLIPTTRSIMSKTVERGQQGCVFGATAAGEVVAGLLGSFILNPIYANTAHFMSGFVFLIESGFFGLSILFMLLYVRLKRKSGDTVTQNGVKPADNA